jgi:hypothetical protein
MFSTLSLTLFVLAALSNLLLLLSHHMLLSHMFFQFSLALALTVEAGGGLWRLIVHVDGS